jgi:hypothetical protein
MRTLVVHESMFGNTEAVADAVAGGLRQGGAEVTVLSVSSAAPTIASDVDLVVLGSPTHGFGMSRASTRADAVKQGAPGDKATVGMREWLAQARPGRSGQLVAIFDTRVTKARRLPAAGSRAARMARRRGFVVTGKPIGFLVSDVIGPLERGELERAMEWGRHLATYPRDRA